MKQLSLIEWIENTEQSAPLQEHFNFLARSIGNLGVKSNVRKYMRACGLLENYINAGMHPLDALFETCIDLDI